MTTEVHPFPPFLPPGARILMAGTFPPPERRWAMRFYYPNRTNDMWAVWGLIGYGDKDYFIDRANGGFKLELIKEFCTRIGLAMTDTGRKVVRLRDNAADKFLEIVEAFDLDGILAQIPECRTIIVTGELAGETLRGIMGFEGPLKIGEPRTVSYKGRELTVWRCPSTSRAYPLPLAQKAEYYREAAMGSRKS